MDPSNQLLPVMGSVSFHQCRFLSLGDLLLDSAYLQPLPEPDQIVVTCQRLGSSWWIAVSGLVWMKLSSISGVLFLQVL